MRNSHRFRKLPTLALLIVLFGILAIPAAEAGRESIPPADSPWRESATQKSTTQVQRTGGPKKFRSLTLDQFPLQSLLRKAPREFTPAATRDQVSLSLPMPDGS